MCSAQAQARLQQHLAPQVGVRFAGLAVMPFMAGLKPSYAVLVTLAPFSNSTGWQHITVLRKQLSLTLGVLTRRR